MLLHLTARFFCFYPKHCVYEKRTEKWTEWVSTQLARLMVSLIRPVKRTKRRAKICHVWTDLKRCNNDHTIFRILSTNTLAVKLTEYPSWRLAGFPLDLENLEKWEYTWKTWKYHGILKNLVNIMEIWHENWKNLVATKKITLDSLETIQNSLNYWSRKEG